MDLALVTGSAGLIGSETVRLLSSRGMSVVGVDNDMRSRFFGEEASTAWNRDRLKEAVPGYLHVSDDIRDAAAMDRLFSRYGSDLKLVVHTAAQPSHDWAARDPVTDFTVNANGTLVLLEAVRRHCPGAVFILTSTNKVYGDTPNRLPLREEETRWELPPGHPFHAHGIDESMSLDQSTHSLFGVSKVAADLLAQEYGRYFGIRTGTFRGGCLTGPAHSGTELHGFLAYLMRCALSGRPYTVFGHGGKQVRDNIHASDLVEMFWHFYRDPRPGEVYNAGGGRHSHCSLVEAVALVEKVAGRKVRISPTPGGERVGDHRWWVSDVRKFMGHYPRWRYRYGLGEIVEELFTGMKDRVVREDR